MIAGTAGALLGDFVRFWSSDVNDNTCICFVVTGLGGSGKSTLLRNFLAGCRTKEIAVRPWPSRLGADVITADLHNLIELISSPNLMEGMSSKALVVDDFHVLSAMAAEGSHDVSALRRWPGHLILSCSSVKDLPQWMVNKFVISEYSLTFSHQKATRRLHQSHHTSLQESKRLASLLPRETNETTLLSIIQEAITMSGNFECGFRQALATKHELQDVPPIPPSLQNVVDRLNILVQLHLDRDEKDHNYGAVALHSQTSTGILLTGPSGTGKTLITHVLEKNFPSVPFLRAHCHSFFAKYLGESEQNLRDFFSRGRMSAPCVMILEDIDIIAQRRSESSEAGVTRRILTSLLCEMDGVEDTKGVLVIATTSAGHTIDGALLRQGRLESVIEVPLLSNDDVVALTAALPTEISSRVPVECVGTSLCQFHLHVRNLIESL